MTFSIDPVFLSIEIGEFLFENERVENKCVNYPVVGILIFKPDEADREFSCLKANWLKPLTKLIKLLRLHCSFTDDLGLENYKKHGAVISTFPSFLNSNLFQRKNEFSVISVLFHSCQISINIKQYLANKPVKCSYIVKGKKQEQENK